MSIMLKEIFSQKECLQNTYRTNKKTVFSLAKLIKQTKLKHIEIVARGSSRNAGEIFKYILENNTDYRVGFLYPSTISKYHGKLNKDTIYLAVSQGGRGEDLKIVLKAANKAKALTIAITNEENSPLNQVAKENLYLKVNKEKSMAATKTFTAEVLILMMLANALINKPVDIYKDINKLINKIDQNKVKELANKITKIKNLLIITRGTLLGVAKEITCKLQETCFINASAYASSDFMHGPLALVDKSISLLFLVPNDETKDDVINLIALAKKNHAQVFIIKEKSHTKDKQTLSLPKSNQTDYIYIMIYTIQLLSAYIAKHLGRNPDKSRNLNKYTKTI